MKVITSHLGADFDSLAAMVAASKLYDGAVMCFSGSASRNVREFLKRYASRWQVVTPRKIDDDAVSLIIAVDVRSRRRAGPFGEIARREGVAVHVYDHHPPVEDPFDAEYELIEPVGAVTTLLVERLLELGIPISPQEAGLFAMGIYEDTGALTFGGTCRRDYQAAATLRELGADLSLIPTHIELSLSDAERALLDRMIENAREHLVRGVRVLISVVRSEEYVEGISLFVHRLRDYFDADVALAAVSMDKRTYLVARSREGLLDVAALLAPYGGGGHPQAAAASLSGADPQEVMDDLQGRLQGVVRPAMTVSDVMTSPVMALDLAESIDEAYRVMIRYGHAALPLVEDGALAGIITRKDLDKAQLHGLGDVQVEEFMTRGVVQVRPGAPVEEAHREMVLHNIGRLPVTSEHGLVGIVTRTDILRALYPSSLPPLERDGERGTPWQEQVSAAMQSRLPRWMNRLLARLGDRADRLGMQAYAVGGFVRDMLLGRATLDIDIVIEGDAIPFLESWRDDGYRVAVHKRYRTGTIVFEGERKVDVATARREFYEYPVASPSVRTDSLKHDLYRRDYSVNAMAVRLNRGVRGTLIDYFGGRRDLRNGVLRVLHNLSFVEDPSRIIRGVRLETRLGLAMEDNTLRLLESCVKGGLPALLPGARLRNELELTFREQPAWTPAKRMADLGIWAILFPGVRWTRRVARCFRRVSGLLRLAGRDLPPMGRSVWLASLASLLVDSPPAIQHNVLDRLHLAGWERRTAGAALEGLGTAEQRLGGRSAPEHSEVYHFLRGQSRPAALFWAAATGRWRVRRRILLYLTQLHRTRPMLTGGDILEFGVPSGPEVGRLLEGLLNARLDGDVVTREDEIDWVLAHRAGDQRKDET
ncbi:MAG: CBS domain-containing protein [Synergistales bacterium]|nr:CBS domain-containing protein [Synergistales bacterium]